MAKHLSEKDIADIVGLIDSWHFDVKLTWEKLCEQMNTRLGLSHSRQTIQSYHRIKKSFQDKKMNLEVVMQRRKKNQLHFLSQQIK